MRIKRSVAVLASTAAFITSGVAFAAWTATGSGSGSALATSAQQLQINNVAVSAADLYPGKTNGALRFTISNPNPYPVQVNTVKFVNPTFASAPADPNCAGTTTGLSVPLTDQTVNVTVPASSASSEIVLNIVTMGNASDDSCQGNGFVIGGLTISSAQSAASI